MAGQEDSMVSNGTILGAGYVPPLKTRLNKSLGGKLTSLVSLPENEISHIDVDNMRDPLRRCESMGSTRCKLKRQDTPAMGTFASKVSLPAAQG